MVQPVGWYMKTLCDRCGQSHTTPSADDIEGRFPFPLHFRTNKTLGNCTRLYRRLICPTTPFTCPQHADPLGLSIANTAVGLWPKEMPRNFPNLQFQTTDTKPTRAAFATRRLLAAPKTYAAKNLTNLPVFESLTRFDSHMQAACRWGWPGAKTIACRFVSSPTDRAGHRKNGPSRRGLCQPPSALCH